MTAEWIRQQCLASPKATETVQWGNDLVFKIAGKMFAVTCLEVSPYLCSFKCTEEKFTELIERPGIVPAPYLARAHWVAIQPEAAMTRTELKALLREAYDEVVARLPKKLRAALEQ